MDPFDDLEAVLSRDDVDARDAGDQVLQRDGPLQLPLLSQIKGTELRRIAVWETGGTVPTITSKTPKIMPCYKNPNKAFFLQ